MTPEYEAAKEWLNRYKDIQEEIRFLNLRIESLQDRALSPASPILSDMPKGSSRNNDRIGTSLSIIDGLERDRAELQKKAYDLYREIDSSIRKISGKGSVERRMLLQLRYLDLRAWDEITFAFYGDQADFYDREPSYNRRCFELHRRGIEELTNILNLQEE